MPGDRTPLELRRDTIHAGLAETASQLSDRLEGAIADTEDLRFRVEVRVLCRAPGAPPESWDPRDWMQHSAYQSDFGIKFDGAATDGEPPEANEAAPRHPDDVLADAESHLDHGVGTDADVDPSL